MTQDIVEEYAALIAPLLPLAKKAYGRRDIQSPQHDASREYTRLLVEFDAKGGSLLKLVDKLGVTYAGARRRITTADLPPLKTRRVVASDADYASIVKALTSARDSRNTDVYHEMLYGYYMAGFSMARIAEEMGLSSANPLYFGVNRVRLKLGG